MRAAVVLTALGAVAFVVSGMWFAVGLAHLMREPAVPHDHFRTVLLGFVASMALASSGIAVLLEGRARLRSAARHISA